MRKHFSATFVAQYDVSSVWPQYWATIQLNLPNSTIQNAQCCSAQHCAQFKQVVSLSRDMRLDLLKYLYKLHLFPFSSSPCIHVYLQSPALEQG